MVSSLFQAFKSHFSFIPACCQHGTRRIFAFFQVIGYFISLEAEMFPVGSPSRCQFILSNFSAINIKMIQSQCSYRHKSFFYRFFNCKLISYIGTFGIVLICLFLCRYKHCFPFSVIQNSCDKGCLRPLCLFSVGGCFYTGKIFLLGFQFHILRKDLCRCITVYPSTFVDLFLKSFILCNFQLPGILNYISLITF